MPGHDVVNADSVIVVEPAGPGPRIDKRDGQVRKQSNNVSDAARRQPTIYHDNPQPSSGSNGNKFPQADADRTASSGPPGLNGSSYIARPSAEQAIWDWETPVDKAGEAFYPGYELQGELLQDQREGGASLSEFSIPYPVSGSSASWPFSVTAPPTPSSKTFTVPPVSLDATASNTVIGTKRKALAETSANLQTPGQKRAARIMSDTSALSSPVESSTSGVGSRPPPDHDIPDVEPAPAPTFSGRQQPEAAATMLLPPRKVFPIQIGDKMFRLSGASISSDGEQMTRNSFHARRWLHI